MLPDVPPTDGWALKQAKSPFGFVLLKVVVKISSVGRFLQRLALLRHEDLHIFSFLLGDNGWLRLRHHYGLTAVPRLAYNLLERVLIDLGRHVIFALAFHIAFLLIIIILVVLLIIFRLN